MNDSLERAVEGSPNLDPIAVPLHAAIGAALERVPAIASLLRGEWLGHPLHAAMSDVPVGAWVTSGALDGLGAITGVRALRVGADAAIGVGLAGTAIVIASGFADWSSVKDERTKRLGFVHGALNLVVTGLMASSLACRLTSRRRAGVALSVTGLALAGLTAWIGGELSYRHGVGARARLEDDRDDTPTPLLPRASS